MSSTPRAFDSGAYAMACSGTMSMRMMALLGSDCCPYGCKPYLVAGVTTPETLTVVAMCAKRNLTAVSRKTTRPMLLLLSYAMALQRAVPDATISEVINVPSVRLNAPRRPPLSVRAPKSRTLSSVRATQSMIWHTSPVPEMMRWMSYGCGLNRMPFGFATSRWQREDLLLPAMRRRWRPSSKRRPRTKLNPSGVAVAGVVAITGAHQSSWTPRGTRHMDQSRAVRMRIEKSGVVKSGTMFSRNSVRFSRKRSSGPRYKRILLLHDAFCAIKYSNVPLAKGHTL